MAGDEEGARYYKAQLTERAEHKARIRAAFGSEPDFDHLVRISILCDRGGRTPWGAAGIVADEIGGVANVRHANRKRLYRKFRKTPAAYRRWASAEDPQDAANREFSDYIREMFKF
jgi:hypothetical protein